MSTIQSNIECPNCGLDDCVENLNLDTGEFNVFCSECGFTHRMSIKKDLFGNPIKKDKHGDDELENYVTDEYLVEEPYGVYTILRNCGCSMGCLVNKEMYDDFINNINSIVNNKTNIYDLMSVTISRFVDGMIKTEQIYSNTNNVFS